jgi:lactoylglutathione lyase
LNIVMAQLNLLVLRCRDIEASRRFYEAVGLSFTTEQHGSGPTHYSCQLGALLLELYPAGTSTNSVRLGLAVPNVVAATEAVRALGGRVVQEVSTVHASAVVRDPDDNAVELSDMAKVDASAVAG